MKQIFTLLLLTTLLCGYAAAAGKVEIFYIIAMGKHTVLSFEIDAMLQIF
jgi:hypothetical protein